MSVARSTAMVRLITPCAGVALMTFISLVSAQELQTITADYDANAQLIAVKQRTLAPST